MREMKDSGVEWIGNVPKEWCVNPIKYNYKIVSGSTPNSSIPEMWDGDIKWITPADYKTSDVYIDKGKRNISVMGYRTCSTQMIPSGSIILSKRAPIGSVAIAKNELCTNQGCLALIKKNESISNKYFYYVLSISEETLNLYGSGTTFKEISAIVFSNISFPSPTIIEQQLIANFLDEKCGEIDTLTKDIQEQIETLQEYKKSIITEAVTKGLDPDVEMKDSGIKWVGNIPKHWKMEKGKYILKYLQKPVKETDDIITCFRDGEVTLRSNRREDGFTISLKEIGYQGIDIGDLVIHGMDGFAGAIGISDSRGKASPVLNVLDSDNNKKYLMYYLRNMAYNGVFIALATGIRVRTCDTSWNKLRELSYIVPPKNEQDNITNYIDKKISKVNQIIKEKQEQLEALTEYKKSLIYEYVTGKKEVQANDFQ